MDDVMLANHIVVARNADDSLNLLAHLDRNTKEFIIPGCDDLRTKKGEKITLKPEWNEYVQPEDLEGYTLHISEGFDIIADNAFEGCNLTGELKIPTSVQEIGKKAFYKNDLTSLEFKVPVSKIAENGQSIVRNLNGDQVINSNLRMIGDYAFARNVNLSGDLYIPEGLNLLGEAAFCSTYKNSASTLSLPSTLEEMGAFAFSKCEGFTGELKLPDRIKEIPDCCFEQCKGFTGDLKIPEGVTVIGKDAFYGCSGLTGYLDLPHSLRQIKHDAFNGCTNIFGNLAIPDGVEIIGCNAFNGCDEITGIFLPATLKDLGDNAITNCKKLEFLYRSENTNMHNNTLKGVEMHIENAMQDITQDVIASFESLADI